MRCANKYDLRPCSSTDKEGKIAEEHPVRENKTGKRFKTFSAAAILPLLLAVNMEQWQIIALTVFAGLVILVSLIYIYLILREKKRRQSETVVVEKIVQAPVAKETVYTTNNNYITVIPPSSEDIDEELAEELPKEQTLIEDNYDQNIDHSMITDQNGEVVEVLRGINRETGMALVVRYNKSFTAKFIQMTDESKGYYNELKNELLSYKKVKSRVSWKYDNLRAGREPIARFAVRGKTLCLYLALNPDKYEDSKYKVERSEAKKYEDVPLLYRIINPRRVKYAEELIAVLAEKYGLEKGEVPTVDYYQPYEHTGPLIGKELIREYLVEERYDDFLRKKDQPFITEDKDNTSEEETITAEERFPDKNFDKKN
jgi:hypothetical protein